MSNYPISDDLGQFFQQWDQASAGQDLHELQQAIATARTNRKTKTQRKTIVKEWQQDLQAEIREGWTGPGQTNHLLKTMACYGVVFEGLAGETLAAYVEATAIAAPGYAEWCRHQHEIGLRSLVWARAAENYYWKLGDLPKRFGPFPTAPSNNIVPCNELRAQEAQHRIRAAVQHLEQLGTLPITATARATAIAAQGISLKTLYRYLDLWHPAHQLIDQSKIPDSEAISAVQPSPNEPISDLPNQRHREEFYTYSPFIKGLDCDLFSAFPISLSSDYPTPRFPIPKSGTLLDPLNRLKTALENNFNEKAVTLERFPQEGDHPLFAGDGGDRPGESPHRLEVGPFH